MCRKFTFLGITGLVGAIALATTGGLSYLRTGMHAASDAVRESVPVKWEIQRARQMIKDLEPEIARNLRVVTREEVEVARLVKDLDKKDELLATSRSQILRLKNDLESGSTRLVYAGRHYSQQQVRDDLAQRFKQFQTHEANAAKMTQILNAREKNLEAARGKLEGMLAAKRELEVEIEGLQARLTLVEVAQTNNAASVDDSHLSQTRQLLDDISTRLDVAERLADSEGMLTGTIPLDETASPELLDEIADYFGEGRAEVEALVSTSNEL